MTIQIFPVGDDWSNAFLGAENFLKKNSEDGRTLVSNSTLILGPSLSYGAERDIIRKSLQQQGALFGKKVVSWREWVRRSFQSIAKEEGTRVHEFTPLSQRESLRAVLNGLNSAGLLIHSLNLLSEEKTFSELLRNIEELRLAGFVDSSSIDLLKDSIGEKSDLPLILGTWNSMIENAIDLIDFPELLRKLTSHNRIQTKEEAAELLFFGFERFEVLEIDLLLKLSRTFRVRIASPLSHEELEAAAKGKSSLGAESSAFSTARSIFSQEPNTVFSTAEKKVTANKHRDPCLLAATPNEELRSLGFLLRNELDRKKINGAQIIMPTGYLSSVDRRKALAEGLGDYNLIPGESVRHGEREIAAIRLFLSLANDNFPASSCRELISILSKSKDRSTLNRLAAISLKAGVSNGLGPWLKLEEDCDDEIREDISFFVGELKWLESIMPKNSSGRGFEEALKRIIKRFSLATLGISLSQSESEKSVHHGISAALKAAAMIASETEETIDFPIWLAEWNNCSSSILPSEELVETSYFSFHVVGDWLPPLLPGWVRCFAGYGSAYDSVTKNGFSLKEKQRLLLKDWGIQSGLNLEADRLAWMKKARVAGSYFFSKCLQNELGEEEKASRLESIFLLEQREWPELIIENVQHSEIGPGSFSIKPRTRGTYSPTLLESWKECAFRALISKEWHLDDKWREAALDPNAMAEGALLHRALELFYAKKNGRNLDASDLRSIAIRESLLVAYQEVSKDYFLGGDFLTNSFQEATLRKLLIFVQREAEFFAEFPDWQVIECEKSFNFSLPSGKRISGKIDRIDRTLNGESNSRFSVYDYKSSSTPAAKDVQSFAKLQLPIYLKALEGSGYPVSAFYLGIQPYKRFPGLLKKKFNRSAKNTDDTLFKVGGGTKALCDDLEFNEFIDSALAEADRAVSGFDSGLFSALPSDPSVCERCDVRPACRIRDEIDWRLHSNRSSLADFHEISDWLSAPRERIDAKEDRALFFSDEQERALSARSTLVMLEASAGSGKTTVLVERYLRSLRDAGQVSDRAALERILAVSFTEKSAHEIRERLSKFLPPHLAAIASRGVMTIHGLCRKIITDYPELAGISPFAETLDESVASDLFEQTVRDFFHSPPPAAFEALKRLLSQYRRKEVQSMLASLSARRSLVDFDLELIERDFSDLSIVYQSFLKKYDERKASEQAIDFNDLERLALRVLTDPLVQNSYRTSFDLILVDEFQDTNPVQREIIDRIAIKGRKNLFVVGDAKQSIYRFRAADVSVFQRLRDEASKEGVLTSLDANYRSQENIVEFTNLLSERLFLPAPDSAKDYEAVHAVSKSKNVATIPIKFLKYAVDENDRRKNIRIREGEVLTKTVKKLLSEGRKANEIAVLFRSVKTNQAIFEKLGEAGIPYTIANHGRFWNRQCVLDGISLLRSLVSEENRLSALALIRSPWFQLSPLEIEDIIEGGTPIFFDSDIRANFFRDLKEVFLFESLSAVLTKAFALHPARSSRFERLQMDKLIRLVGVLESRFGSREEVIAKVSQASGYDSESSMERQGAVAEPAMQGSVRVMSVHASKGLQFPVVILCDLDSEPRPDSSVLLHEAGVGVALKFRNVDGEWEKTPLFIEMESRAKARDIAELKRLLYVAVTRAESELYFIINEAQPKKEKDNWGGWLRSVDFGSLVSSECIDITINAAAENSVAAISKPKPEIVPKLELSSKLMVSVSELSAAAFCKQFQSLKFSRRWEDSVIELWPRISIDRPQLPQVQMLSALGISKMTRGIALHQTLEQLNVQSLGSKSIKDGLLDSYRNLGIEVSSAEFNAFIEADIRLLDSFLSSNLGKTLFDPKAESFPELSFLWLKGADLISGSIDRVVRTANGRWIVADYKSAIGAGNLTRYRFQVAGYMAALKYFLMQHEPKASIEGWLIDLESGEASTVDFEESAWGAAELKIVRDSKRYREKIKDAEDLGVIATEACMSCAYVSHCTVGRQYVLNYS
jgi:ATP-dependent exoDNAse (exonuclease V) beta subunit